MSAIIVSIVVSANGLIAISFDQHLVRFLFGSWIRGLFQKAVLLDIVGIISRSLSMDPWPPVA